MKNSNANRNESLVKSRESFLSLNSNSINANYRTFTHIFSIKHTKWRHLHSFLMCNINSLGCLCSIPNHTKSGQSFNHIFANNYRTFTHFFTALPITFLSLSIWKFSQLTFLPTKSDPKRGNRSKTTVLSPTFLPLFRSRQYRSSNHTSTALPFTENDLDTALSFTRNRDNVFKPRNKFAAKDVLNIDLKMIITPCDAFFKTGKGT